MTDDREAPNTHDEPSREEINEAHGDGQRFIRPVPAMAAGDDLPQEAAPLGRAPGEEPDYCGYLDDTPPKPVEEYPTAEPEYAEVDEEEPADLEEPPAAALARLQHELMIATQQRDILSRQVDSLVQRLAASYVAQGVLDPAAAQGFAQKEILPINNVLAQIAQANAAEPQREHDQRPVSSPSV